MNKLTLFLLFAFLLLLPSCFLEPQKPATKEFAIQTNFLGHKHEVSVFEPDQMDTTGKINMIFVIDGQWHADHAIRYFNAQSPSRHHSNFPSIIVSMNTENIRNEALDISLWQNENGAIHPYLMYLKKLIREVEASYPGVNHENSNRVLLGHSLGGLFALSVYLKETALFDSYILLSPSLWVEQGYVFEMEQQRREHLEDTPARVIMTVASLEPTGSLVFELAKILENHHPQISLAFREIKNENHSSSVKKAIKLAAELME
ncbi:alpha/beta hydrolase [Pleomorphovibrio marinus]|uniref:alpha/beta hydrolase n=1 Tax=Pleomorphovibrio marinus TaxID=2164132 RepID=UPI000E0BDA30|nr:alpha/beta hydrolase-fold protein [Pleomorphovibrio marinus]